MRSDDGPALKSQGVRNFYRLADVRGSGPRHAREKHKKERHGVIERGGQWAVVLMQESDGGVVVVGEVQTCRHERDADELAARLNGYRGEED